MIEPPSWIQLRDLMSVPPDPEPLIAGVIRRRRATPAPGYEVPSYFTESQQRVWRQGRRARVEDAEGKPTEITGDRYQYRFDGKRKKPVRTDLSEPRHVRFYSDSSILDRRDSSDWLGDDFTTPTGPVGSTTFLGRPCWSVELAPPEEKPAAMQLLVDAETGIVLQQRNDSFGIVEEWTEFTVGGEPEDGVFEWDGKYVTAEDEDRRAEQSHERWEQSGRDWFAEHVTARPLVFETKLSVLVHDHSKNGSFNATIGQVGMLRREPVGKRKKLPAGTGTEFYWRDARWMWTVEFYEGVVVTAAGLRQLQQLLDSDPVDPS